MHKEGFLVKNRINEEVIKEFTEKKEEKKMILNVSTSSAGVKKKESYQIKLIKEEEAPVYRKPPDTHSFDNMPNELFECLILKKILKILKNKNNCLVRSRKR